QGAELVQRARSGDTSHQLGGRLADSWRAVVESVRGSAGGTPATALAALRARALPFRARPLLAPLLSQQSPDRGGGRAFHCGNQLALPAAVAGVARDVQA